MCPVFAAEQILSRPIDVMKRALDGTSEQVYAKDMSFAQELVIMPPFCKESASLPAVIKGIHTKVVAKGGHYSSDPLITSSTAESLPESSSASAPACKLSPSQCASPQQLKEVRIFALPSVPLRCNRPFSHFSSLHRSRYRCRRTIRLAHAMSLSQTCPLPSPPRRESVLR